MSKPRVKCGRVQITTIRGISVAYLDRLSHHPKLGSPRTESQTRTSRIVRVNRAKKEIETLNTIYWWEDNSAV